MSGKHGNSDDKRIEREIRSRRPFSIAEAVGREGASFLKGESPTGPRQRLLFSIKGLIERYLPDTEGALRAVLLQRVWTGAAAASESGGDAPHEALKRLVQSILRNQGTLRSFVADVDAEWGRLYRERPYFDPPNGPPSENDPYPTDKVRRALERLLQHLA